MSAIADTAFASTSLINQGDRLIKTFAFVQASTQSCPALRTRELVSGFSDFVDAQPAFICRLTLCPDYPIERIGVVCDHKCETSPHVHGLTSPKARPCLSESPLLKTKYFCSHRLAMFRRRSATYCVAARLVLPLSDVCDDKCETSPHVHGPRQAPMVLFLNRPFQLKRKLLV